MNESIECPHKLDGSCRVSSELAQVLVPLAQDACTACVAQPSPRAKNSVTCSKAIQYRSLIGLLPTEELLECVRGPSQGVGSELELLIERTRAYLNHVWLSWLLPPRAKCGCHTTRSLMNQLGIHGCTRNRNKLTDEILARWQMYMPAIRFVPMSRFLIGVYISSAIQRLRSKEIANG